MVSGLIASAVINHGPFPPKEYIPWTAFSPHHVNAKSSAQTELSEAQLSLVNDHNVRVLELVAKMRAEDNAAKEPHDG